MAADELRLGVAVSEFDPAWQQRDQVESLPHDEVHIWSVARSDFALSDRFNHLQSYEIDRSERIKNPLKRALYLAGRNGLRFFLQQYTGLGNDALLIRPGTRGKPALLNSLAAGELCFNYTLSGDQILYAFCWNQSLGVDLETYPRTINAKRMAERKLTAAEIRCWQQLTAAQRNNAMLQCWTRKEALGKVLGVGIRYAIGRAELFTQIERSNWSIKVDDSLFQDFDQGGAEFVGQEYWGVQLKLPYCGAASIMGSRLDMMAQPQAKIKALIWSD